MRMLIVLTAVTLLGAEAALGEDPWADAVIEYVPVNAFAGYDDPNRALGEPAGGGPSTPSNTSLVSLGSHNGRIVLKFNTPITDDPANPFGLDCIVYSNSFWVGGNPQRKFQEPALIEVSRDANNNGLADDPWYLIPGSRALSYVPFPSLTEPAGQDNEPPRSPDLLAGHIRNPNFMDLDTGNNLVEYNWGYAEMTPTAQKFLDNYVRPDNPLEVGLTSRSGGGDAFDIAWAVDAADTPAGLTQFDFIRLTCFIDRIMGVLGPVSPDIEAVADVAPAIDGDGDGIRSEYEVRVSGTDPARRESTVLPSRFRGLKAAAQAAHSSERRKTIAARNCASTPRTNVRKRGAR